MIVNALAGKPLPVYGDGGNVRDWLYVGDHCAAIRAVLAGGRGRARPTTSAATPRCATSTSCATICAHPRARCGRAATTRRSITFVTDRPGHDRRYAIDATKIRRELGWRRPRRSSTGLARTCAGTSRNAAWLAAVTSGEYQKWITAALCRTRWRDAVSAAGSSKARCRSPGARAAELSGSGAKA